MLVSDELVSEGAALNEAVVQQDVDSSSLADDCKDVKQRSVSPTNNINSSVLQQHAAHSATSVSFDAQPVNFYLRLGAIGSLADLSLSFSVFFSHFTPRPSEW